MVSRKRLLQLFQKEIHGGADMSKSRVTMQGIPEKDCARCGKRFVVQPFLVYKRPPKYFCSYTCYDTYLNEIEAKKQQGKARKEKKHG
jgi:hypothetical protein